MLLIAYKQLALNKRDGGPVFTRLQQLGAGERLETGRVRLDNIQHLIAINAQQQTVRENCTALIEGRLVACLPFDLAAHTHTYQSIASLVDRVLGIKMVLIKNGRLCVGAEV